MTAIRKHAIDLLQTIPEENMEIVVRYMESLNGTDNAEGLYRPKAHKAYQNLQKYFGRNGDPIDYKKELLEALDEKYESAN